MKDTPEHDAPEQDAAEPAPAPDAQTRPLVTFAVFAYNQEKYIREAVEGAFSQTYSPLEIILSDDCSSDRTFEIMQEMAAGYVGPHEVRVRRCAENIGLISHVNNVVMLASGSIIVFSAGDDISIASRTKKIVEAFQDNPSVFLVHSQVQVINSEGEKFEIKCPPMESKCSDIKIIALSPSIIIGASAAMRRTIYDLFGPINNRGTYEDLVLGFRAALLDGLHYIPEPMVHYRREIGISSQFRRKAHTERIPSRIALIKHRIATLQQRYEDTGKLPHQHRNDIYFSISKELKTSLARLQFHQDRINFFLGFFSTKFLYYVKAFSSESKFVIGVID